MKTLQSELIAKGIAKSTTEKKSNKEKKKASSSLSRREIEELMGVRRDTFKRVNGSVRRK